MARGSGSHGWTRDILRIATWRRSPIFTTTFHAILAHREKIDACIKCDRNGRSSWKGMDTTSTAGPQLTLRIRLDAWTKLTSMLAVSSVPMWKKSNTLLWRLCWGRLPTRDNLWENIMETEIRCLLCDSHEKNIEQCDWLNWLLKGAMDACRGLVPTTTRGSFD